MAAKIVDESSIVSAMIHLLSSAPSVLQENAKGANASSCKLASTPKWMTPLLLFIDLYEKVILGMNRRGALQPVRKLLEKNSLENSVANDEYFCRFVLIHGNGLM